MCVISFSLQWVNREMIFFLSFWNDNSTTPDKKGYSDKYYFYLSQRMTKPTTRPVWPVKTQISLYIYLVWQGFIPIWTARGCRMKAFREDWSDCMMHRLIWVFTGRTSLIVGLSCAGSFFHENIYCGYSLEISLQFNLCFYGENEKYPYLWLKKVLYQEQWKISSFY